MKKLLLLISLFSIYQANAQQNLVLNPSFEENFLPLPCGPMGLNGVFPITNWSFASIASTDIYSTTVSDDCFNYGLGPNLSPRSGNNFVSIYAQIQTPSNTESWLTYREYIRGKLSSDLQIGIPYRVEFFIRRMDSFFSNTATNNIGVKFINDELPIYQIDNVILEIPDVNYSGSPLTNEEDWTLLSFIFVPNQANLDAFIIGNFFEDNETLVEFLDDFEFKMSYYSIDDVAVYAFQTDFNIPTEICEGDVLILPTTSESGLEGTWSPAPNNQETTTYFFTPNISGAAPYEFTVIVNPKTIPEFDEIGPFCDELPTFTSLSSISNNGVEGTWSPAFNPNQTGIYTFIPNEEFCAETIFRKVIIDETPIFEPIDTFCEIDENFSLPTVSTNGISGSWSPEFDPNNSQTYTFTRDFGDCTQQVTLNVVINPQLKFELFSFCNNDEYFVEIQANNFSLSEITDIKWLINHTQISEFGTKIKLTDYSNLLQEINTIEIIFTDSNGCLQTQEVKVFGKYLCKIQKGISPNGDGLNEYFDLVSFGGVDLKIFNRYGSVVYENSNYTNDWKGQSNSGKKLPTGTYFYVIKTRIGEQFSGYIQLTY